MVCEAVHTLSLALNEFHLTVFECTKINYKAGVLIIALIGVRPKRHFDGVSPIILIEDLCSLVLMSYNAGADLENFMTVAHRAWLISRRGQTKEFCDCLLWGW